ncbi:universal stress protein [Rhizobium sp. SSA_523]|uniref:universal stress protein n=1 Tax=Rhizobium sp. SSA_523 TaxID=2952477 RepID=UPI00209022A9|nr:universal stress protein [Rhizobium sp. SSA_523]MCO5734000.1 universal stress protein [Rhizobium sp. SSA_523]WKC24644.1 universal stress protein [Rhizobium sp. SSA_523]
MGYRTIVAILDNQHHAAPISDFAVALARQFSAHVIGLHVEAVATVPLIAPMEIPDPTAIEVLQKAAQEETRAIEAIFRKRMDAEGLSYEWRNAISTSGYHCDLALSVARTSDLILAYQADERQGGEPAADLEALLIETGRPLLLVPHVLMEAQPIRRALIAWNGSKEAARAAFDALPLLKDAESVEIFSVDPPDMAGQSPDLAGADLASALARHGVNVALRTEENCQIPTAAAIENRLTEDGVDLLVMGGYGSSRWWEFLFGGVTRSVLESMTAVTLLSR